MTADFQLIELIRRTAVTHADVASPAVIAELALEDIPVEQYQAIVEKLLPRYVGEVLRRSRTAATTPHDKWEVFLGDRVAVKGGAYRFAADCNEPELRAASARRKKMAGALDRRAVVYATVADAVHDAGVATAGQLDAAIGAASLVDISVLAATAQAERMAAERALRKRKALTLRRAELEQWLVLKSSAQLQALEDEVASAHERLEHLEADVKKRKENVERLRQDLA